MAKGSRKISGQTVTVQPPLTVAAPRTARKQHGQLVGANPLTFGSGSASSQGGSKKAKPKRTRHY